VDLLPSVEQVDKRGDWVLVGVGVLYFLVVMATAVTATIVVAVALDVV
jgi:hypothetical protein